MKYLKPMAFMIFTQFMQQGCVSPKTSTIVKSKSLQDVVGIAQKHLEKTHPDDVLVLFDINYTLTHLPMFPLSLIKKYSDVWAKDVKSLSQMQQDLLMNINVKNNANVILDPNVLEVLAKLRQMGVKSIAFTAALSGKIDQKETMKTHVYNELKSLGISFEYSFPKLTDIEFTDLPAYYHSYPLYYKGILFANGEGSGLSKGDILVHFLKHIDYTPKVVIIADDRRDNIAGLERALATAYPNMQLEGVEYLYGHTLPAPKMTKEEFHVFLQDLRKKVL